MQRCSFITGKPLKTLHYFNARLWLSFTVTVFLQENMMNKSYVVSGHNCDFGRMCWTFSVYNFERKVVEEFDRQRRNPQTFTTVDGLHSSAWSSNSASHWIFRHLGNVWWRRWHRLAAKQRTHRGGVWQSFASASVQSDTLSIFPTGG